MQTYGKSDPRVSTADYVMGNHGLIVSYGNVLQQVVHIDLWQERQFQFGLILEGKYKRVYKSKNLEWSELTSIDLDLLMHPSVQHLLDMFAAHLVLLNINPDDDEFKKELHKKVIKVEETKRWCPDGGVSEVYVVSSGANSWWYLIS